MSLSAADALSAFCLVMEDISSREEEVSSIDAACSEDPSASDWLAEETWLEADDTCSAASERLLTTRLTGLVMERLRKNPRKTARTEPPIMQASAMILAVFASLSERVCVSLAIFSLRSDRLLRFFLAA